jgi:hypothetical protein
VRADFLHASCIEIAALRGGMQGRYRQTERLQRLAQIVAGRRQQAERMLLLENHRHDRARLLPRCASAESLERPLCADGGNCRRDRR